MNNLKIVLIIFFTLILISCGNDKLEKQLEKDKVYLVFRDSQSKEGYFAKKFNDDINSKVSHVGILFYRKNWLVLHADNLKGNCIQIIPITKFKSDDNELNLKILEILDIKANKFFFNQIDSFAKLEKKFDLSFSKFSRSKTYCSRFVADFLQDYDTTFSFKFSKRHLNNIESAYLKLDTLEYYPVDMFFMHPRFKNIIF